MNKLKYHFRFDMQLLKGVYFIPFIFYLFTLLLMLLNYPELSFLPYIYVQGMAIPIAGIHVIFLYSYIYDEGATDTLLPYHKKNIMYDLLRYSLLHGAIILCLVCVLIWVKGTEFLTMIMAAHLLLLFIFFQLIGVAVLTLVKSLDITIAIIAIYVVTEVVTLGEFLPWPPLFIFEQVFFDIRIILIFFFLIVGIILSIIRIWRVFK